jgi:hypothetical protein
MRLQEAAALSAETEAMTNGLTHQWRIENARVIFKVSETLIYTIIYY